LAKAHWAQPELVAEITYLSWPDDGVLRHKVFVGLRQDKTLTRSTMPRLQPDEVRPAVVGVLGQLLRIGAGSSDERAWAR
jgi:ATP-dependent DNA ligase